MDDRIGFEAAAGGADIPASEPMAPAIRTVVRHQERRFHLADARELLALLRQRGAPLEYVAGRQATDITTVYLDTPWGTWSAGRSRTKLRCKNYDDPSAYWFELKHRKGLQVDKRRQLVAPGELPSVLVGTRRGPALRRVVGRAPLIPLVAVRYRRIAFEWPGLRVTVDRDLHFCAAGSGTPWTVGRCIGRKRGYVVEVKCEGPMPAWLRAPLRGGVSEPFSKSRWALAARSLLWQI
jgi:hypothetical protein